jgi:hypothetical protein
MDPLALEQSLSKWQRELHTREHNINEKVQAWQRELLKREHDINERELELKKCDQEFDEVIKVESEKLALEKHCPCCSLNLSMQPDTIYAEWAVFKNISGSETRIGVSSVGTVYLSETFLNIYHNWLETELGQSYKNSKLKSVFITKLELSWAANDWRMIDNFNSKIIVCELNKRYRIKFVIE